MDRTDIPRDRDGFEIAIVCALKLERDAVEALMEVDFKEEGRTYGKASRDRNAYTTGVLGGKAVVLAYPRDMGTLNAATVATELRSSFRNIKLGLVVGVAGATPRTRQGTDIVLGDLVISTSVVQYDFGRQYPDGFRRRGEIESTLGRSDTEIANFIAFLEGYRTLQRLRRNTNKYREQLVSTMELVRPSVERDRVFPPTYRHKHRDTRWCETCSKCIQWDDPVCEEAERSGCDELGCEDSAAVRRADDSAQHSSGGSSSAQAVRMTRIHFGRVASSNGVMKSGMHRDRVVKREGVVAFEMEGAGTWDQLPTVIVKSVCDYADSHKNKAWQDYAAVTAASCAKALLEEWEPADRYLHNADAQASSR
jgi:nucleoside phosphorylase